MTLDVSQLPREYARHYVPAQAEMGQWAHLEPLFNELAQRPLDTVAALEQWLLDWSELTAAVQEEAVTRYIRMTCQTDDAALEKAYLDFVENVEPHLKPAVNRLEQKFVACPVRAQLPAERYAVLNQRLENRLSIFRAENVSLETEVTKLVQQCDKIIGAMTVDFDGQERTLQQMASQLDETERSTRQRAWELIAARRLKDSEELNRIFEEMLALRHKIARNAGFENYRDYAFRLRERFDYTPEDCAQFHAGVEQHVVPLMRTLQEQRRRQLGLDALRPWDAPRDANPDPEGRPPLRPFTQSAQLIEGCAQVFDQLDAELGAQFRRMLALNLLDLDNRKGKAPGGYQENLGERRLPFIFMNAVGRDDDVRTLLHEGGHAFQVFASRAEPLYFYRDAPMEFSEVASMSMELLGDKYLAAFYPTPDDALRSRQAQLESIVNFWPWCATIDAFQHWLYTHPGHSRAEREACWLDLRHRFGGVESWSGLEAYQRSYWQRQHHLFEVPFYYIEYGIAQLGAVGLWNMARQDERAALTGYRRALALGGSRPLPELFQAAGLPFDFTPDYIAKLTEGLRAELL